MENEAPGLFSSLKNLLATFLAIVRTRAELFSVEFEEELERICRLAFLAAMSFFLLGIAVILIVALIVVAFWEENRLLALGLLALFFLLAGTGSSILFMNRAKSRTRLFSQSLDEFARDLSELE